MVVVAPEPPVAGIMAKIQAHSTAKQINQIQDKPYVITQKQVQQQHFQKLKVRRTTDTTREKSLRVRTILFVGSLHWILGFSVSPLNVESSESNGWLTLAIY